MLNIVPIPALKDNYIWLIINTASSHCLIVDPGEAEPVLHILQAKALKPTAILLTHHHADHTAGVTELLKNYSMPVFGPQQEAITTVTQPLHGDQLLSIDELGLRLQVLSIPGHTKGHLAYYGEEALFCGDTLFTGGCGRVFEGSMAQMYAALQRLAYLPAPTQIYCGHEYTLTNLEFALTVEPGNSQLQQRMTAARLLRQQGLATVPSTLALENQTNPFLRCHQPAVKQAAEQYCGSALATAEQVFGVLRLWKNEF